MTDNVVTLKLDKFAHRGEAIGRLDRQVVFVAGAIPGEEVKVAISDRKRDFLRGTLLEVLSPSPDRVEPRCPHFGRCGGCLLQHVRYSRQLSLKQEVVADQLRRVGGFLEPPVRPMLGMDDPWQYRNHARFSVTRDGRLAFTRPGSHWLEPVERCYLMHERINEVIAILDGHCRRYRNISVRYGFKTGQLLIGPKMPENDHLVETGQPYYEDELGGHLFRISAASFFQVNPAQAEVLVRLVRERLALTGNETVVDAYCGVGTFAILLAGQARRVIGIEESASALVDAAHNAKGIDNVEFIHAPVEKALPGLQERVDAVVIDPPRAGCRPEVLAALVERRPQRIVYVSCDAATLARDLRTLAEGGYRIDEVQPLDMFPHTYHVECVVSLKRKHSP